MGDDLISRQAAIDALEKKKDKKSQGDIGGFYNKIIQNDIDTLMLLPSADRPQGEWIRDRYWSRGVGMGEEYGFFYKCSMCEYEVESGYTRCGFNYCPYCGCRMKGADDDNLSAEVICRKLYKYGLIDRGRGYWRPKKRPKYRWPARAIRKAEQTEPQKKEVEWVYNKRERLWYPYSNGELLFNDKPTTQTETQNSNLTFEKDECAKEYEELGLKELKELKELLDNLKICINEHPIVADWLVEIADRKAENCSEKPNNCTEPQTDGYMTAEQAEDYRKMLDKAKHKVYGNIEDEPQTEPLEQFRVGLEYHTDTTHFGKTKGESVTMDTADTPQTDLLVKTQRKSRESDEKNCETCRDKDAYDEWEGNCDECENGSMYTPQTYKDKVVCPNCGRSDYIRSFEKDFNIKNSGYRYKCINCNTYIKDTPQTDCGKDINVLNKSQADCPWK